MFADASWSAICTDGILEALVGCAFTEICTDGIFRYTGPVPPSPPVATPGESVVSLGMAMGVGI